MKRLTKSSLANKCVFSKSTLWGMQFPEREANFTMAFEPSRLDRYWSYQTYKIKSIYIFFFKGSFFFKWSTSDHYIQHLALFLLIFFGLSGKQ